MLTSNRFIGEVLKARSESLPPFSTSLQSPPPLQTLILVVICTCSHEGLFPFEFFFPEVLFI